MSTKSTTKEIKPLTAKEIKSLPAKAQKAINKLDAEPEEESKEVEGGKIEQILSLFVSGVPAKFIVRMGYNKSTVYRQTGELKKLRAAPAMQYYGFELFETRLQKLMKAKHLTREAAFNHITEQDLNA